MIAPAPPGGGPRGSPPVSAPGAGSARPPRSVPSASHAPNASGNGAGRAMLVSARLASRAAIAARRGPITGSSTSASWRNGRRPGFATSAARFRPRPTPRGASHAGTSAGKPTGATIAMRRPRGSYTAGAIQTGSAPRRGTGPLGSGRSALRRACVSGAASARLDRAARLASHARRRATPTNGTAWRNGRRGTNALNASGRRFRAGLGAPNMPPMTATPTPRTGPAVSGTGSGVGPGSALPAVRPPLARPYASHAASASLPGSSTRRRGTATTPARASPG